MYLAMDELGTDAMERIRTQHAAREKWHMLSMLVQEAKFEGIQITSSLYENKLGLSLDALPETIRGYRLTYHMDRPYNLLADEGVKALHEMLRHSLSLAQKNGIEDVSIHPPSLPATMLPTRGYVRDCLHSVLSQWVPTYRWAGVTLSLESHMYDTYVFQGLADYANFIQSIDGLGALIDIADACYAGYTENDLLEFTQALFVTGFHISDADGSLEKNEGTHMPVGKGIVGIKRILAPFVANGRVCGALEVRAPFEDIKQSAEKLRSYWKKEGA